MTQFDTSTLPAGITSGVGEGGLPVLDVRTEAAQARIYLQGAHVASWRPAGQEEVLWLSPTSAYAPGKAIRGGIPLCAPWFGPGRAKDKAQAHGWFRAAPWQLVDAGSGDGDAIVRFALNGEDAPVPEGEPSDVSAEYVVRVGPQLRVDLTVTAGADGLDLEEALHAYFTVSDVADVRIEGLAGSRYVDKTPGGRAVNAQSGDLALSRHTDRVYAHDGRTVVVDPAMGRRINVDKAGSGSTVVWNPWESNAAGMADVGSAWRGFVCVEAANALDQYVRLEPGASHTISATYSVGAL